MLCLHMVDQELTYYFELVKYVPLEERTYYYSQFRSSDLIPKCWLDYGIPKSDYYYYVVCEHLFDFVSFFENRWEILLANKSLFDVLCYIEFSYFHLVYSVNSFVEQFVWLDNGYKFIGKSILSLKDLDATNYLYYNLPFNWSFIYGLKFCSSLLFLIFIRAGLPRYRYDYLTKLGWAKFLVFTLFILMFVYFIFMFL